MRKSDIIYVKQGPKIVCRGIVAGPYQFDSEFHLACPDSDIPWPHQVPVDWDPDFEPIDILLGSEPTTVLPLSGQRLQKLEAAICTRETVTSDLDSLHAEEKPIVEGGKKRCFTNHYERNPKLRTAAILYHGTRCMVCGFDFEKFYGKHGTGYIEAHHLRPVSSSKGKTKVNPKTDMAVVCSNCHRMIHRKKNGALSLEELKNLIQQAKN